MQTGNVAGLQTVQQRSAESGASERTQRMADSGRKSPGLSEIFPEIGRKPITSPLP